MGWQEEVALVGVAQYRPERQAAAPCMLHPEPVADLTQRAPGNRRGHRSVEDRHGLASGVG